MEQRKVPPIGKERNLPRFGMLDSGYPANLEFRWTFQSASQFLRNFGKFHEGAPQFFWGCLRVSHRPKREVQPACKLFVEKAGLRSRGSSGGGLPARDAHDPENSHLREGGTRNKDTVRGRI